MLINLDELENLNLSEIDSLKRNHNKNLKLVFEKPTVTITKSCFVALNLFSSFLFIVLIHFQMLDDLC